MCVCHYGELSYGTSGADANSLLAIASPLPTEPECGMLVLPDVVVIGQMGWEKIALVVAGIDQRLVLLPAHPHQLVSKGKSRVMLNEYGGGSLVVE